MIYKIVLVIGKFFFKILYRPTVIGKENIPKKGRVIIAGNHTNNLDAAIVLSSNNRRVNMLAKKELFDSKLGNWFFKQMGCIRVDRKNHKDTVKEETIERLENGEIVGLFPEGTVNRKRNEILLLPFKHGAVSFAKKTDTEIVPFAITGNYKLFKKSIKIEYGKPYKVKGEIEEETNKLMNKIGNLIKGENNE